MRQRNVLTLSLFLGPFLIFFIIFLAIPLLEGTAISFTDFPLIGNIKFTGFKNFSAAFSDPIFIRSMENTIGYILGIVPLFVISMIAALALQKVNKGRRFFTTIIFLPYIIPMAVHGFIFSFIYQPDKGVLGTIFKALGIHSLENIAPLTKPSTALIAVLFVWVYVYLGYITSILYAGLQDIPTSYYESAQIDGAGKIRTFFSITLPLLGNVLVYVVVTCVILSFQIFPLVWVLTGGGMGAGAGGPSNSTMSMDLYIYQTAFRDNNLGYASAMGFLMFIFTLLITTIPFKLIKEVQYD